jgi:glutathione S-transferase
VENRERKVSMYQLHYFPANTNAAPHMSLEDIGVKYDLVLAPLTSKKETTDEIC